MKTLILLLLPFFSFAQLNVKDFGAKGTGSVDDQPAIQRALDSAVKTSGRVYIPAGKYRIDKPLMIYRWDGVRYQQCYMRVEGESAMWDNNTGSVIIANFKDAFALGVQLGKGVEVSGLTFTGKFVATPMSDAEFFSTPLEKYNDSTCRDNRWSPYAGIVVDPFGCCPVDGVESNTYPSMREWYRGPATGSGSTALRFYNLSVGGFTIDILVSPNGYTRNAEQLLFSRIRFGDAKIGFAGCQDQEKSNRIENVGCWSRVHTLFAWSKYGIGRAGHYVIDGVNVAGGVNQLLFRESFARFPLHMYNVFAESLGSIGTWSTLVGDGLHNSSINFQYPDYDIPLPDFAMKGYGVAVENSSIRYYGLYYPIIYKGFYRIDNYDNYVRSITGNGLLDNRDNFDNFGDQVVTVVNSKAIIKGYHSTMKVGNLITFFHHANWEFQGQGVVLSYDSTSFTVGNLSTTIKNGGRFGIGRLKNQL